MKPNELDDFLRLNRMTGNELAAKLGVHYVTISRWRNGHETIPKTVELALKWIEATYGSSNNNRTKLANDLVCCGLWNSGGGGAAKPPGNGYMIDEAVEVLRS